MFPSSAWFAALAPRTPLSPITVHWNKKIPSNSHLTLGRTRKFIPSPPPPLYILWVMALLEAGGVTNNGRYLGFYQELQIRLKSREIVIFLCFTWKITHTHSLWMILPQYLLLLMKEVKKNCIFTPKRLDHLLLMASSLVTIATDHNWTQNVSKCGRGMNEQLLKTSGADILSSREKNSKKPLRGCINPLLYVQG